MPETLAGTGVLIRLGLRRDRWLLPVWIAGFAATTYSTALAGAELYPDMASRVEAATALNATASIVALFGTVYDPTSIGALSLIKYTAFMTAILAVLMVFITVRHTRSDEESGRLELLGGGRLGRDAPLAAALTISFGASIVLGLVTAAALAAGGLPAAGSIAFGLGWAATGMAFSAVAGVTAQLTASARAATGISLGVVAVTYALRAVGDLAEPGPSALSWLSPIGWNQQIRAFAGDHWWVLALPLALCPCSCPWPWRSAPVGTSAPASARSAPARLAARSAGSGPRRAAPVPAAAAWAVAFVVFGVVIGSLAGNVTDLLSSPNAQDLIMMLGGTQAMTDAFIAAEISIMGLLAAAFGLSAANRLERGDRRPRRSTAGHRHHPAAWATSHFALALAGVAVLMLLAGVSIGAGAAAAVDDAALVGRGTVAALAQVPAAWVVTAWRWRCSAGRPGWPGRSGACCWPSSRWVNLACCGTPPSG